jgi:hypothetical protein
MANNPWRRKSATDATFSTWNSTYGSGQSCSTLPRHINGMTSPSAPLERNTRSTSVPPQLALAISPPPAQFAPITSSSAFLPQRAPTPTGATRPRLFSSPGRVLSASSSVRIPPPSPSHAGPPTPVSPEKPNPARVSFMEESEPSLPAFTSALPPVRIAKVFRRTQSTPAMSPMDDDDAYFEIPLLRSLGAHPPAPRPASAKTPPSPGPGVKLASSPSPTTMLAGRNPHPPPMPANSPIKHLTAPSPTPSSGSPAKNFPPSPPATPRDENVGPWRRGGDRPKTSGTGRKPMYGEHRADPHTCFLFVYNEL